MIERSFKIAAEKFGGFQIADFRLQIKATEGALLRSDFSLLTWEFVMSKARFIILASFTLALTASAVQRDSPTTITSLESQFMQAAATNGSAGYMSFYAADAVELPDGADAIKGADNIAPTMAFLDQGNKLTWTPEFTDMSGDLAYTYGTWTFTSKDKDKDGNPVTQSGKYTTIWKRQSDGKWKVVLDMGNSSKSK
jgi:ketosteroid isomerase-like protein